MKQLIKEIPRAIIISISIFLVLLLIRLITGNQVAFDYALLVNFGYNMLYGFSLYFANAAIFIYLDQVFKADRFTPKRILIGFVSSFLISIGVIFLLRIFEDVMVEGTSFSDFLSQEQMSNYLVAVIITFIVTLAFHAFYFYKAYAENKVKEQKVIAGTASAQFESLKNQIDPHFLFNSLNVLSSLIEENPDNAQKFTTSLSKIYRYVLEQKDKELVSVAEELAFAKTYMNLLKMRFENSISYELPTEYDNPEAKVVPLSLQLLLENTIKHNVASEQKPLHIKIYIENNYLIVENNLQKKEVLQDRKGVGLQNIVNRYGLISERKVLVDQTETAFKVKIPILTKQIVLMETQNIYNENMAYMKAKERVEKLKGFYGNLISYCCVIPFLIFINLKTGGFQWFWFPMLGWGMGLTFHALETFGYGKSWEERKIREILNKENSQHNKWS
ncbi:2TM domain-containing protein [Flavobacterium sp. J49]|uniref:2TM domain-containing protein n=1 Tax=Flavobacterium sp. J49 TaxID=2718534 RepID=UPI001594C9D0|nr:2TM domain-containing protein [Flavobacterium sp. J49]MBF6639917.1 2TM domain-containing protein [Flavobacterium sp. J49]NIC01162.1 Pr2TM family membrane protein [Flavobacterium sp. J49]